MKNDGERAMIVLKILLIIIGAIAVSAALLFLGIRISVYCELHGISLDPRPKLRRKSIERRAKHSESVVTESGNFYLTDNGTRLFGFTTDTAKSAAIEIPDGIKSIADGAFLYSDGAKLGAVKFGEGLKVIGNKAFMNCFVLSKAEFPAGLEAIGDMAFCNCAVEEVDLSRGIKSIGKRAFDKCRVKRLRLPDTKIFIGDGAFAQSEVKELYICGSRILHDRYFQPWEIVRLRDMMLKCVMEYYLNEKLLAQAAVNIFARNGDPEAEAYARENAELIYKALFDNNCLKEVDDLLKITLTKELAIKMTEYARKNDMRELFLMLEKYRYDHDYFDDSAADKFEL